MNDIERLRSEINELRNDVLNLTNEWFRQMEALAERIKILEDKVSGQH